MRIGQFVSSSGHTVYLDLEREGGVLVYHTTGTEEPEWRHGFKDIKSFADEVEGRFPPVRVNFWLMGPGEFEYALELDVPVGTVLSAWAGSLDSFDRALSEFRGMFW